MPADYIYNPARKISLMERASEFYWNNRDIIDSALFLGTVFLTVGLVVAVAA